MSIVVGVPPSHNEKALESGHFGVLRTAASLMPLVLIGIGALATFYLAALALQLRIPFDVSFASDSLMGASPN
jgi:tellurite resistance protein TehA-like permease